MSPVEIKAKAIRDLLSNPWKLSNLYANRVHFNKAFTSLDTIEDAQESIIAYQLLPEFDSSSGGYLYLYGLMQSLFMQQDGVISLYNALFQKTIDLKREYPELYKIREHRRLAVAHPTNTKKGVSKAFSYIARMSISKDRFEYLTHYPENNEKSDYTVVDTQELITNQESNIVKLLGKIEDEIMSEIDKHKSKFKNLRISDLININHIDYYFQNLVKDVGREVFLSKVGLDLIRKKYEEIKTAILERHHSTLAVQGVEHNFDFMEYLIKRLQRDLVDNQIEDEKELYVFIDALHKYFYELIDMCKEIDDEFSQ